MKKIVTVLFLVNSFLFAQTNLIISEYVEGSGNNSALELYNGTSSNILVSGYNLDIYFNGSTVNIGHVTLNTSFTISPGDVFVVCYSGSEQALKDSSDLVQGTSSWTGNDAIILRKGTDTLDVIGQVGNDPGAGGWGSGLTSTADHTLRRKAGVTTGDTNPNDAFDPSVEWDGYPIDTFDGLGNRDNPLPIELTTFTASVLENSVQLNWETATEVNNYGFEILRFAQNDHHSESDSSYEESIGFVQGNGTTNSPKSYSFTDPLHLNPNLNRIDYRLKQIDNDGTFTYSKTVTVDLSNITDVDEEDLPTEYSLSQNYPNPFNPSTAIRYSIPVVGALSQAEVHVSLKIYDILGNEVATLVNENKPAGNYEITLNASNFASGMYFYRLQTSSGYVATKKLMLLK